MVNLKHEQTFIFSYIIVQRHFRVEKSKNLSYELSAKCLGLSLPQVSLD